MGFSPLASHDSTVDSPLRAVWLLVLISNAGGAEKGMVTNCYSLKLKCFVLTLNTDVDDGGEPSSDSIGRFAEIVALTGFLNIFEHQSSINNLDIGLDLGVELSVVLRLVSCNKRKPSQSVEAIKLSFMGF